jgi:hypothetical protein
MTINKKRDLLSIDSWKDVNVTVALPKSDSLELDEYETDDPAD